ncbi:MAG: hypothetical protein ACR2NI_11090 [Pirellulales bacterium]
MAKSKKEQRRAEREAKRAMRANKQQQRRDAKTERQAQRQATRIAAKQERSNRVQSRQDSRRGRVSDRAESRTARTGFRQNPLNVAQRQQTMRGAFDNIAALGGNVIDFLGDSQEVQAFNENPEAYADAFGIGSGVTPAPFVDTSFDEIDRSDNEPQGIAGFIDSPVGLATVGAVAVGGIYYLSRR